MKAKAIFHGILSEWFGTGELFLELPQGASLRVLMCQLRERFFHRIPQQLWDPAKQAFVGQVLATKDGEPLKDLEAILEEGEEIHFFLLLAGG